MNTLEDLRRTIDATEDLRSIVRTMMALAAVSIRQYERAVQSMLHYTGTIEQGLQVVLRREWPVAEKPRDGLSGLVVFGSDYGLCGRFNDQMAAFARQALCEWNVPPERERILAIGLRLAGRLNAERLRVSDAMPLPRSVAGVTATVQESLVRLDAWRSDAGGLRVLVLHNRQTADARATPTATQLLPLDTATLARLRARAWPSRSLPQYAVDSPTLLTALLRQYLFSTLFRSCVESMASENAARLASMQAAERNIEERLGELRAGHRRLRQEAITAELLDVVAGFEALQGVD